MKTYGINTDLLKKLINKFIIEKNDQLINNYELNFLDNGHRIFIFVTFYLNNNVFSKHEEKFYQYLIDLYGNMNDIPEEEYDDYKEYLINRELSTTLDRLIYNGMNIDRKKYRIVIELVE